MTIDTADLTKNWKTTVFGLSVLVLALIHGIKFDVAGHLAMTAKDWFGVGSGCITAFVGWLMKDAGTVEGTLPSGEKVNAEGHETPNDPNVTPVTEQ